MWLYFQNPYQWHILFKDYHITQAKLLEWLKAGRILGYQDSERVFVSFEELYTLTGFKKSRCKSEDAYYVGKQLQAAAAAYQGTYVQTLHLTRRRCGLCEKSIYVSPSHFKYLQEKDFHFAGSSFYRYNAIVKRFRPFATRRALFLCCLTRKDWQKVEQIAEKWNKLYPDTIRPIGLSIVLGRL